MVIHIKERYCRFRAWQESPFHYAMQEGEAHCCRNCGHEFVGNFCPCCGQKATLGEVNWPSVRENVMEVWGVGTHSLPAGFFIQVFLSTLTLIICTLSELLSPILVMVPIYYVVAYRQLFGYGLWGTLWRMAVCVMAVVLVAISIAFFVADLPQLEVDKGLPVWQIRVIVVVQLVIYAAAILGIGYAIGRRTQEKRLKKNQS